MADDRTPHVTEDDQRIFDLATQGASVRIVETSEEISRQVEAIRRLDEVTRQVELPYVGSYYSA